MPNLTNHDLFFIWDSLNDRRVNCLDLIDSDPSLDVETIEDLMEVAHEAGRIQDIISKMMDEEIL